MAVVLSINQVLLAIPLSAADQAPPSTRAAAPPPTPARFEQKAVVVNRTKPVLTAVPMMPSFSDPPTTAELTRARVFEEPLLPVGGTPSTAENRELARLITSYLTAGVPDGTGAFDVFLRQHSESPWRASLLTDLGVVWRRTGHFSKAYNAWQLAWALTKDATDANGRVVADKALGEYVELSARLGHFEELTDLLRQIKGRIVRGSAAEKVSGAHQAVWMMHNEPGHAFRCGPLGLDLVLAAGKRDYTTPEPIRMCQSTKLGTSLLQMRDLAKEVGDSMMMAQRSVGAPVVVPALVHWNVGHFAALVARQGDRFLIKDPTFGDELWITAAVLDEEASGFFLVRTQSLPDGWRTVGDQEGNRVWGKGQVFMSDPSDMGQPAPPPGPPPPFCGGGGCPPPGGRGMPVMSLHMMLISITLQDTPLWYSPPKGPAVEFRMQYNQREAFQPQTFSYGNLGTKWTFDWQSYITDDPSNPAAALTVYLRGGGQESVTGYDAPSQSYASTNRYQALVKRVATSPVRYERQLPDGSIEVFGQPDGGATFPRRVFLTESRDPQGNALTFTYDASLRLVSVADALGQVSTISYQDADPLKITAVTDPFGRTASFAYDATGRLQSITDMLGLSSSFEYRSSDVVSAMTTPYGTTHVTSGEAELGVKRWAEITDPLGGKERVEYGGYAVLTSEPQPAGMQTTANINHHNTQYWDARAMAVAPGDPASATDYIWALMQNGQQVSTSVPLGIKRPLENRVWYSYQGGAGSTEGTVRRANGIGRVLDDGSSQVRTYAYNARGRLTQETDPLGRETDYVYDSTGLDLLQTKQKRGSGWDILETRTYNSHHQPLTVTDAAGQITTFTYNGAGQVLTVTNAKSETTTYAYDTNGYLQSIADALAGSTTTFAYDSFGRLSSVTDSEGYAVATAYDIAGRVTDVAYPDSTSEHTTYNRLDLAQRRDRLGRLTQFTYDSNRRIVATRDPMGRTVTQEWCLCGSLDALVDGNGNRTRWTRDLQGRVLVETRADGSVTQYAYENTTPRLQRITDPKSQVETYTYARDNALLQTVYTGGAVPTPTVSFTYDSIYARPISMVDGTGTTAYGYHTIATGQLGAGQLASIDGPLTDDTITYEYDELGRVTSRAINGVGETSTFDALGRIGGQTNALGAFAYTYVGSTSRLTGVTYPNGQTTSYSYYAHAEDDRLKTIHNRYPSAATLSKFDYAYDATGNIVSWQQQADSNAPTIDLYAYDAADELMRATRWTTGATPVTLKRYAYAYDSAGNRTSEQVDDAVRGATYDTLNRLVSQQAAGGLLFAGKLNETATVTVAGQHAFVAPDNTFSATAPIAGGTTTVSIVATDPSGNARTNQYQVTNAGPTTGFIYDANGNLSSDGDRSFEWDARNQLVAVTVGAHRSEYSYDGYRRRVRVVERVGGSIQSDTHVIWCGIELCEERASDGITVQRRLFSHGEQVGSTQRYFTKDHLESVRDVTGASGALVARYEFDPYGRRALVDGNDVTNSGLAGHQQTVSGISLSMYRGYDSESSRWLNEDPVKFVGGLNLYKYNDNNPINRIDSLGLTPECAETSRYLIIELTSRQRDKGGWELAKVSEWDTNDGPQKRDGYGTPDSMITCVYKRHVRVTTVTTKHWLIVERCKECNTTRKRFRLQSEVTQRRTEEINETTGVNLYVSFILAIPPEERCRRLTPMW